MKMPFLRHFAGIRPVMTDTAAMERFTKIVRSYNGQGCTNFKGFEKSPVYIYIFMHAAEHVEDFSGCRYGPRGKKEKNEGRRNEIFR